MVGGPGWPDPPDPEVDPLPPAPRHQDVLLRMYLEEQRVLIDALIEVLVAIGEE